MSDSSTAIGPVEQSERISSLDAVRGAALLGILLMNVNGFGLHPASYDDPTVAGGATGANLWAWIVNHVAFEGKMRALFSMLFGAGVIVLTERGESRGHSMADIYYRRLLWLMLFGIAHAFLLWWGEILYPYALCGLALYPFRKMTVRALLITGGVMVLIATGGSVGNAYSTREARDKAAEAARLRAQGKTLTDEQTKAEEKWKETLKQSKPTPAQLAEDNAKWLGGFKKNLERRAEIVMQWHSIPYWHPMMFDLWMMMILGMAFYKMGMFHGALSYRAYALMSAAGYAAGVTTQIFTARIIVESNFDLITQGFAAIPYEICRVATTLGHIGVLMMILKAGALRWLTSALAAVGQMAFSNYVSQSVICYAFFYLLGWYGKLERIQLLYFVLAIWTVQLLWSPLWLRAFRFGPLEWAWRSLTYWSRPPFRRESTPVPAAAPPVTIEN
jgi:uncharacterized protein